MVIVINCDTCDDWQAEHVEGITETATTMIDKDK